MTVVAKDPESDDLDPWTLTLADPEPADLEPWTLTLFDPAVVAEEKLPPPTLVWLEKPPCCTQAYKCRSENCIQDHVSNAGPKQEAGICILMSESKSQCNVRLLACQASKQPYDVYACAYA